MGSLHLHIQLGLVRFGLVRLAHKGTLDLGISFIGKRVTLKTYKLQQRVVFGACNAGILIIKEIVSWKWTYETAIGLCLFLRNGAKSSLRGSKMFWLPSVIDPQVGG